MSSDSESQQTSLENEKLVREEIKKWIATFGPRLFAVEYGLAQKRIEAKALAEEKKRLMTCRQQQNYQFNKRNY